MPDLTDRRRYTRVDFNTLARLTQGDIVYQAELLDISLKGLLVKPPEHYRIDATQPLNVLIALADDATIQMKVTLAHISHEVLGFTCQGIDLDSIAHLRRLVELNIGDTDAAERVLAELLISD